ncbi:antibiotic biosynthesis monooxygenase family protein [Amycolatopsis anabasis]|uniref:antibiotic biosynthesis monooxygenase family protein n=1 Tax=Amycolatopsis anabasis TaxID=1840409 RepID=UPI00131D1499|nr:antibiotic biosynthesis monooxygenase [Amycolatopsis anabasis]
MAVVKINTIEVPEGAGPELEKRFAARLASLDGQPGFLGFELLRPVAGETRYFVYSRWETDEDFQNWQAGGSKEAHGGGGERKPVGTGAGVLEFEVVLSSTPKGE